MVRGSEVRDVPRGDSRKALAKAEEFVATASGAMEASRWDAAGLAAVHAGISAADAALIAAAGIRSISSDHGAAVKMLEDRVTEFGGVQRRQLTGLVYMKNTVEYEQRLLTATEAKRLVDQAQRLVVWATGIVASRGL